MKLLYNIRIIILYYNIVFVLKYNNITIILLDIHFCTNHKNLNGMFIN